MLLVFGIWAVIQPASHDANQLVWILSLLELVAWRTSTYG